MKISALSSASLPLSGSEIVPVVQAGINSRVSVTNILSSTNMTFTALPRLPPRQFRECEQYIGVKYCRSGDLNGDVMYFNRALVIILFSKFFRQQTMGCVQVIFRTHSTRVS